MSQKAIEKYLLHYAEPSLLGTDAFKGEINKTDGLPWQNVCVVPAKNESTAFWKSYESWRAITHPGRSLFILVLNSHSEDSFDLQETHSQMIEKLQHQMGRNEPMSEENELSLLAGENFDVLLLRYDLPARQLPKKKGVGLARKIGCDHALRLMREGLISWTWIHSTDADAILPQDYFSSLPSVATQSYSGLLYPFRHIKGELDDVYLKALELYDYSIRYYSEQMKRIGSAYDFIPLGSCIAVHPSFYAMSRGFPKRDAAEDFYLLNKLRKLAPLKELSDRGEIQLQGRLKTDLPFGTAPATRRIGDQLAEGKDFEIYDSRCFDHLQKLNALASLRDWSLLDAKTARVLDELKLSKELQVILAIEDSPRRERRWMEYLDALRSLRFVHEMTRLFYPKMPLVNLKSARYRRAL